MPFCSEWLNYAPTTDAGMVEENGLIGRKSHCVPQWLRTTFVLPGHLGILGPTPAMQSTLASIVHLHYFGRGQIAYAKRPTCTMNRYPDMRTLTEYGHK